MNYNENRGGGFERKMYSGDWVCSKCQAPIKELPFEPDPERLGQLLCRDCHRERQQSFRGRGGDRRPFRR